jgi:hypothetical protein
VRRRRLVAHDVGSGALALAAEVDIPLRRGVARAVVGVESGALFTLTGPPQRQPTTTRSVSSG